MVSNLISLIALFWCTILAISFFLVIFVAPMEIIIFNTRTDLYITSIVQALIAILFVLLLIVILNYLKRVYIRRKLKIWENKIISLYQLNYLTYSIYWLFYFYVYILIESYSKPENEYIKNSDNFKPTIASYNNCFHFFLLH